MADAKLPKPRRPIYVVRAVRARPRLFISSAVGIAVFLTLPSEWQIANRLLIGWNFCTGLYLMLLYYLVANSNSGAVRRRARVVDESRIAILVLTAAAALASLGAIIALLGTSHGEANRSAAELIHATLTIMLSWAFTHTIFAVHYAHEYYDENAGKGGGLTFPGTEEPDYWDFVYFSFVIGMTSQVSDVCVSSPRIRRTVTAHGIVSFVFNVALLALTVNIAASAI
jgi:uncharacterized membrane protein